MDTKIVERLQEIEANVASAVQEKKLADDKFNSLSIEEKFNAIKKILKSNKMKVIAFKDGEQYRPTKDG